MELTLRRAIATPRNTSGLLFIDGVMNCHTLELPMKNGYPGSAIPAGRYKVITYPSPKFGRLMPLIIGIPSRSQIEIHWGNTVTDTDGCVLVGKSAFTVGEVTTLEDSRLAFEPLWAVAQGPMERGECWITVVDPLTLEQIPDEQAANLKNTNGNINLDAGDL